MLFYMFGQDKFEDWVTPAVVRLCFSSLRLSRVSPRSQPLERVTALFSGFVPGGIRTVLGSSVSYADAVL